MQFSLINLLAGKYHQLGAVVLMRGETFIETIEEGGMVVMLFFRGTASVSRQRMGAQAGVHLTPRCGEPIWLTSPGTYCIAAKDHVVGVRMLKTGGGR